MMNKIEHRVNRNVKKIKDTWKVAINTTPENKYLMPMKDWAFWITHGYWGIQSGNRSLLLGKDYEDESCGDIRGIYGLVDLRKKKGSIDEFDYWIVDDDMNLIHPDNLEINKEILKHANKIIDKVISKL